MIESTSGTETTPLSPAKRLVDCGQFRWLPGMLETDSCRLLGIDGTGEEVWADPASDGASLHWVWPEHRTHFTPDLSDPATLGCLLALVREAWGEPELCVRAVRLPNGDWVRWVIVVAGRVLKCAGTTGCFTEVPNRLKAIIPKSMRGRGAIA